MKFLRRRYGKGNCPHFLLMALLAAQAFASPLDAVTRLQDFEARRASSTNPDLTKNGDARGIDPGAELTVMEADGPGTVVQMWFTMRSGDPFYGRSVVLRIYYDGLEQPSANVPIGDFFGLGNGLHADYQSAVTSVTSKGRSKVCYWRMPFKKHVRIAVANESTTHRVESLYWHINWQELDALPDDAAYFHAAYRQQFPAEPGNYEVIDIEGKGHYVGTVYSAIQVETGWFGEGDDFFYIDGADTPQLRGTGTEEYFLDAWGFREFAGLYGGAPIYEGVFPGDCVSVYRWHLPDPIPFDTRLRLELEHRGSIFNPEGNVLNFELGTFEERPDWLSSVAFWYQSTPAAVNEPLPPVADRMPPYTVLPAASLEYRADPGVLVMPTGTGVGYVPQTKDASIEFDFNVDESGHYQIRGLFLHAVMAGVFQAWLDGEPIGEPLDFVIGNADPYWVRLDTHKLDAGTHTLRFEGVDRHAAEARALAPKFHGFGLDQLLLIRLEDMEGFQVVSDRLLKKSSE